MVAEMVYGPARLALLYEPDRPEPHGRCQGWGRTQYESKHDSDGLRRKHGDDEYGAQVQHAILRYVLGGQRRATLAADLGVSETTLQYMLRGHTWGSYGRPVLRSLRRLGITTGRGDWMVGATRAREIIAAQRSVMRRALAALEGPPQDAEQRLQLLADLRLLTIPTDGAS